MPSSGQLLRTPACGYPRCSMGCWGLQQKFGQGEPPLLNQIVARWLGLGKLVPMVTCELREAKHECQGRVRFNIGNIRCRAVCRFVPPVLEHIGETAECCLKLLARLTDC